MQLLDNGFDSLKNCVAKLKTVSTIDPTNPIYEFLLKDITISLHHSTESLFKYLVQKHNPYLIYADICKYFEQEIQKKLGNLTKQKQNNSIQFLDAIHFAIIIYNIQIEKDTYVKIKKLNDTRNELTHFTYSFIPKETENYIALLLPELYKVYNAHIPEFNAYARENGLYSDTLALTEDADIWGLGHAINLMRRWKNSKTKISELLANPTKIKEIFDNKKTGTVYHGCPCCGKDTLYITSSYITGATNTRYLGTCEYCGLQISEEDGKFFSMVLDEDTQISEEEITHLIIKFLCEVFFITRYDRLNDVSNVIDENKTTLTAFMDENSDEIATKVKTKYRYLFDDVCQQIASAYFDENIYFNNDVVENHFVDDSTTIELEFDDVCNDVSITEENEHVFERFKLVSHRFSSLSIKEFDAMVSSLQTSYVSYHSGMFMNFEGNEQDVEFTIEIHVSSNDIEKVKLFL